MERKIRNIVLVLSGAQLRDKQDVIGFTLCNPRKKDMGMVTVNEPTFMKFRQNIVPCPVCILELCIFQKSI